MKIRKYAMLLIALLVVFSLSIPAFAGEEDAIPFPRAEIIEMDAEQLADAYGVSPEDVNNLLGNIQGNVLGDITRATEDTNGTINLAGINGFSTATDSVFVFTAQDKDNHVITDEYGRTYYCDFVVSFDKDVAADSVILVGKYADMTVPILLGKDFTGNNETKQFLISSVGYNFDYNAILDVVDTFFCKAINISPDNIGTTANVSLVMWPKGDENKEDITTIATVLYKFTEENLYYIQNTDTKEKYYHYSDGNGYPNAYTIDGNNTLNPQGESENGPHLAPMTDAVAKIGDKTYNSLEEAVATANADTTATADNPVVVELLTDTNVSDAIMISNHVTLDGGNNTITTTANRGIRIDQSGVAVSVKNLTINGSAIERAIQVDSEKTDVTLSIENVTATATFYCLNIVAGTKNLSVTIKDSTLNGWAAINSYASNSTFAVEGSTLKGVNTNSSYSNDFSTIVFDGGDIAGKPGSSYSSTLTIKDCTIIAEEKGTNTQNWISFQYGAADNTALVSVSGTSILDSEDGNDKTASIYMTGIGNKITMLLNNAQKTAIQAKGYEVTPNGNQYDITLRDPEVFYYWPNPESSTGYSGADCMLEDVFNPDKSRIGDGESVRFEKNAVLTKNSTCGMYQGATGTLNMTFGDYSVTKGEYRVTLAVGTSIKSDKEIDFLAAPEGYKLVKTVNGDGTYTYSVDNTPVAQVGDNTYVTLDAAVKAVTGDSGTIKLLDNVDLSQDPITSGGYAAIAPEGKSITLDLNGKTISGGALDVYGTLTTTGSGSVTGLRHGIWVNEGGVLNVQGGTITNTGVGYPIIANPGTVNISGGTVTNTSGAGAVYVNNGTLIVTGGAVSSSKDNTEAVRLKGTTTARISSGTVTGHDWGVVVLDTASLTVSGDAEIRTANDEGYAISTNGNLEENATVTIDGGTINGAELGIYQPSGKLIVNDGSITGATAVYFKSNSLNITGGTFTGNGDIADYDYNGNGANPTGDALVIDSCNYPNGINDVSVSGGNFKSTKAKAIACYTSNGGTLVEGFVTGGKYSTEPDSSYVATDHMAVGINDDTYHYQVGYATVTTGDPEIEDDTATYTVNTVVKEDETSTELPLKTITNLTVTVTGTNTETTDEGNAGVAVAALNNIKDDKTLGNIVTEAIETAGAKIEGSSNTVSIVIQVVKSAVDNSVEGKATYEVHPEAVIKVNNVEVGTVELTNSQLNNTFSFKLYAKAINNVVSGDKIKVTHIHDDGTSDELGPYTVDADGYINVTGITEFSKFTLEEITIDPGTATASFGYTIALEDSINIVYNVKNLSGTPDDYTITYTDPDSGEEVTKHLTDKMLNSYVIAKCAAKEMGDVYNVVVKYNNTQINKTTNFSIKEYCDAVINGSYGPDIQNLCKSTLDYGRYAQETFNYNTESLVNGGKDYFTNENIEVPDYSSENTRTDGTIKTSLALVTTSETKMVVYFKKADGSEFTEAELNGATVTVDGDPAEYTTEAGKVKVVITGISAKDLAVKKVVRLTKDSSNWWQLKASPVDYMGLALKADSQVKVNRAFYNYYLKADTFFKNK